MTTIRHLKIFLTVAETRNMSEAAARLYVSQPTVSQTIGELNVVCLGVIDLFVTALDVPLTPRGDDGHFGGQCF